MNRPILLTLLGWIAVFGASAASALTVTGTIRDSANQPIPGIRVEVYHLGAAADLREAVFADATGVYSSNLVQSGDNVYILARWDFALQPAAAVGGHVVSVVARGAGDPFVATTTYLAKLSPTVPNVTNNLVIDLKLDQVQPAGLTNIPMRMSHMLTYIDTNRGSTPWSLTVDIPVVLITDDKDRMTPSEIYIGHPAFDGTGTSFDIVTAYHELGHWLHYHHNGNALPPPSPGSSCGEHTLNSEEDRACALTEGYASFLAQLTAEANGVLSPFYRGYRDDGNNTFGIPPNSIWRGDELGGGTGWDLPTWESGEVVEGAVSGFLFGVVQVASFEAVFGAMIAGVPANVRDVLTTLSDQAGLNTAPTLAYHGQSQLHGLVFSRGQLQTTTFTAPAPPSSTPPSAGNWKEIGDITFLRGVVPIQVQTSPASSLGISQRFAPNLLRLGVKAAAPGLASPAVFLPVSPYVPAATGVIPLDTLSLGAGAGDGDWDLAVQHQNAYGFEDDFLPTWNGDPLPLVNTDESYLKNFGTWFDRDLNPTTNQDPEGMVVVDNTAPTVSNFKP